MKGRKHNYTDSKGKDPIKEELVRLYYPKIMKVNRIDKTGAEFKKRK